MTDAIAHRGPDDEGFALISERDGRSVSYSGKASNAHVSSILPLFDSRQNDISANIGLGHRRFSIIELSAAGHQPFFDHEQSCCVVFNGEIYNYLEIREVLISQGATFRTDSDTEVLIEAYKFWGTTCFEHFNGFWALAIYDFNKKKLIFSRDRLGKKPLFWTKVGPTIYFASEIKALLQVPGIYSRRKVNEEVAFRWLVSGQKDIDEGTFFEGIFSFPAASWCVVDGNFPENAKRFWCVPRSRSHEKDIGIEEAVSKVKILLGDAVHIRKRADVPVAVELSGGIDSSVLAALATMDSTAPDRLTAVTVRFPQRELDEEPFARAVAEQYKLDFNVIESPSTNFWGQILRFTRLEEEPYHAPNLQTNQAVWSRMRDFGIKVSLNGAGGDEVFAGYGHYFPLVQAELFKAKNISALLRNALRHTESSSALHALSRSLPPPVRANIRNFVKSVSRQRVNESPFLFTTDTLISKADQSLSERLQQDIESTLMPYWLSSGDRGYMGVPIEVRAPFLDYRVIDYAFQLPISYLIRNGWHKWILRKAMEDVLPSQVLWRRRKLGFPFPIEQFYRENEEILDLVFSSSSNPYINMEKNMLFRNDWRVLSFILWYELFFNENLPLFQRIEDISNQRNSAPSNGYIPAFLHMPT
jgi:asparagine synthase (glutamine-hydrolysing)